MAFKPLEELEGPIVLPYRGHEFVLPTITYEKGLDLQARAAAGELDSAGLAKELTGDVLVEMAHAGASLELLQRVAAVAVADFRFGRQTAEQVWNDPKEFQLKTQQMMEAMQRNAKSETVTRAGAAGTTRTRASGTGTRKRKVPADHKAPASRGKKSSDTGA